MAGYPDHLQAIRERQAEDRKRRQNELRNRLASSQQSQPQAPASNDGNGNGFLSDTVNNVGKIGKGIFESATAIPRVVISSANAAINEKSVLADLNVMNDDYQSGKITKDELQQKFDAKTKDVLNVAMKVTDTGIVVNTKGERAVDFAKKTFGAGVDTASILPVGGAVKGAMAAKEAGKMFTKASLKEIALNNVKQSLILGTATNVNQAVQGKDPLTPTSIAMNYLAPAALGAGAEVVGKVVGTGIKKAIATTADIQKTVNPQAGSIKLPGSQDPIKPIVPPAELPTHGRLNPTRTNPAGLPEELPSNAPDGTPYTPVTDAAGTPGFLEGRANPKVFGESAQEINSAKDNYITAIKGGDVAAIKEARAALRAVPTDQNGTTAKNALVLRIDDFADNAAATPAQKSFAPLDESTQSKVSSLKEQSVQTPLATGHVRLFQTNDSNGGVSDQYFKNADNLSNYINGRSDNATLSFKDVPAESVEAVPGKPTIFRTNDTTATSSVLPESPYTTKDQAASLMYNRKQQIADTKPHSDSWVKNVDQLLFDKNVELKVFGEEVYTKTGKRLPAEDDPYALAQLIAGAPDAAKEGLRGVFKDMDYISKNNLSDDLMHYGVAKQILADRAGDYPEEIVQQMQGTINRIESSMSRDQMTQIEAARLSIKDYHLEQLLRMKNEGTLSAEWYNNILAKNTEYFTGFNFASHVSGNERGFAMNNSMNNAKNPLQSVKGIDDAGKFSYEDPRTAIPRQAVKLETQLANSRVIGAINRFKDANPDSDLSVRLTTPQSIDEAIGLNTDSKALRPIRDSIAKAIKRDAGSARKLETVINNLNKKGMNISLRDGGARLDDGVLKNVDGVGGSVATSKTGGIARDVRDEMSSMAEDVQKAIERRARGDTKAQGIVDQGIIEGAGIKADVNASQLGSKDTTAFFRHLIENNSRSQIDKIKKAIGNKDAKLADMLDDIGTAKSEFDDIATQIKANREAAMKISDEGKDVPDGYEVVETWQDGKRIRTAVLQPIADALKGKNDVQLGFMEGLIGASSKPFRAAVTVASPGFAPVAGARDFGALLLTSKNIPVWQRALIVPTAARWARGLFDGAFDTEIARKAAKAGMGGANTLADSTDKLVTQMADKFGRPPITSTKDLFKQAAHVMNAPGRAYMKVAVGINRNIEYASKLAEFRASLDKGNSVAQAAVDGRRAVADSQNSGGIGRLLNMFVPFTNMTLQGAATVARYAKNNPGTFTGLVGATIAAPTMAAYSWNQSMFPEVYNDISQSEKDTYFIIIMGDNKDKNNRYTDVLKIPKTEAAKVFSAPIEAGLAAANGEDHDAITTILLKSVGWTIPVQIERNGEFSGEAVVNSTVLANPLVKASAELASNHDFYTGNSITPESLAGLNPEDQVKANTPGIDKVISKVSGGTVNPLQAGVIRKSVSGNLAGTDPGTQLTKRTFGAYGGAHKQEFYQIAGEVKDLRAKASNAVNKALASNDYAAASAIVASYKQKANGMFGPWMKDNAAGADQGIKDTFDDLRLNLTAASVKTRLNTIKKNAAKANEAK